MSERRKAIGYMRISTPGQATNGLGLKRQERKIREIAERLQFEVVAIYEDTGTAGGPFSDVRLGDLQTALKIARVQDMPIIVSELSRLTRTPSRVNDVILVDGVEIISGKAEETISPAAMRKVIERAHRSRLNISRGTMNGHARRKARGEVSGHVETLEIARENSLATRQERAGEIVDLVAAALEQHPEYQTKTAAEVAQLLNDMGILSGWRRPFTTITVRRVFRAAKKELEERRLVLEEDDLVALSPAATQPSKPSTSREEAREDLAELDRMLGRPVRHAHDVTTVETGYWDELDDLLADLDLTLGREETLSHEEVAAPAARVAQEDWTVDGSDDDLSDLDRALEREEVYTAAPSTTTAGRQPRMPKPARTRSSTAPAAVVPSVPLVVENPVPKTAVRHKDTATETAAPSKSPVPEEMDESYKDHPTYGIF